MNVLIRGALLVCSLWLVGGLQEARAQATGQCPSPTGTCPVSYYKGVHLDAGICPEDGDNSYDSICFANNTAPKAWVGSIYVDVLIACEPLGDGQFLCEAWPQGDGLSYAWSATNMSYDPPPPTLAGVLFECTNGFSHSVSVSVYSPQGQGASKSRTINCP